MATQTSDPAVATSPVQPRKIYVQRLLHGKHEGTDPDTGLNRRYHAGVAGRNIVRDFIDLSARWPEKFEKIHENSAGGPNVDPETVMRPGETLNDFAARIAELAKTRGASLTSAPNITNPTAQTAQGSVSTSSPQESAPTVQVTAGQYATFEAMTLKELVAHCEAEEIPIKQNSKKEDILKILKGLVTS